MCELGLIIAFGSAHFVAWATLGGGWRGAARAPFAVFIPAAALLLLNAVFFESYGNLPLMFGTLLAWELLYLFGYLCLRVALRPVAVRS